MVARAPVCINRADKICNIITLVVIAIVLLRLYHGILGTRT